MLRRGDIVALRRIEDCDPTLRRSGDVDVVDADARPADHLQALRPFDDLGGDLRAAANDQAFDVRDAGQQVARADSRAIKHLDPLGMPKDLESLGRQQVRDEYLPHLASPHRRQRARVPR